MSKEKLPLLIGDRVVVYSHAELPMRRTVTGVATDKYGHQRVRIEKDYKDEPMGHWYHAKQCRRLVKKAKSSEDRMITRGQIMSAWNDADVPGTNAVFQDFCDALLLPQNQRGQRRKA